MKKNDSKNARGIIEGLRHIEEAIKKQPRSEPDVYTVRIELDDKDREQRTDGIRDRKRQIGITRWLNWITGLGTIVGLVGLVFVYRSFSAAQQSADTARDAYVMDQRAWIAPNFPKPPLKDGLPIFQIVPYAVKGKSPAKKIRGQAMMVMVHNDDNPAFDYPSNVVTRSDVNLLFPDATEGFGIYLYVPGGYPQKELYSGQVERQYESGDLMFMIYGRIEYDDVFNMHHWLQFCSIDYNTFHLATPPVATKCGEYNDLDATPTHFPDN